MKSQDSPVRSIVIAFILLLYIFSAVSAEPETEGYIAVHKKNELSALYAQVKGYLDENGQKTLAFMDESRNRIITQSLIRSWAILQYEVPAEKQIDDAYDSLFNMSIFVKLTVDPKESVSDGTQTLVVNKYFPFPWPEIGTIRSGINILLIKVEAGDAVREEFP